MDNPEPQFGECVGRGDLNESGTCNASQDGLSIARCDIFDFIAYHVGKQVMHPGGLGATRRLAEACKIDPGSHVLDIACGRGTSAIYIANRYGCRVTGIDLSTDLVAEANSLARRSGVPNRVSFKVGDATALPSADGKFDVVMSQAILMLVTDANRVIKEALRVVRPGGRYGALELTLSDDAPASVVKAAQSEISASCIEHARTAKGWQERFIEAGGTVVDTLTGSMEEDFKTLLDNEGPKNAAKIMLRWVFNSRIRTRMDAMNRFFRDNNRYFGYGIYINQA